MTSPMTAEADAYEPLIASAEAIPIVALEARRRADRHCREIAPNYLADPIIFNLFGRRSEICESARRFSQFSVAQRSVKCPPPATHIMLVDATSVHSDGLKANRSSAPVPSTPGRK